MKAIIFGLNYPAVKRLTKTWNLFTSEFQEGAITIQELSEVCENNEAMDRIVHRAKGPCVPFIGKSCRNVYNNFPSRYISLTH